MIIQILATAHTGAEVSKQIAALESAVGGCMAQLEHGIGVGDRAAVFQVLQAAVNSPQAQVGNQHGAQISFSDNFHHRMLPLQLLIATMII
jgi:hypothetical protein